MKKNTSATGSLFERKALVVDDGPVERLAGKAMLEKLGYVVASAASGEEALALFERERVSLVLCDISMPGMGGIALLEAVNARPLPPPFIMVTSHDDAEHAAALLRNGAAGYLTKPLRFDALRDTINNAMTAGKHLVDAASQVPRDPLTGLLNKTGFSQLLSKRLQTVAPDECCGALLLLKAIDLKTINHSYGRIEGNKALQLATEILSSLVRPEDLLGRMGGDLFAIHFDDIAPQQVHERAFNLVESVESVKLNIAGEVSTLSVVAGGACAHGRIEMEDLLNHADFALQLARDRGRNRVHVYSDEDEVHKRTLSHQLNMAALVRAALRDPGRLVMHYQPINDLVSGEVRHYEALLRVLDESGKPCNTGELVKVCEVFGLISQLDRAVVKATLAEVARIPAEAGVAINLSGKSIGDPDLLQFIESEIKSLGIEPGRIIFELTETSTFHNLEEVRHFVGRIKNLGCRFALDDFGVGFSSFYYIKELDFDYLKLDGSFIAKLPHSPNDQAFVRAMVEISRVYELTVIAEWVEDGETVALLRDFGVPLGQGYFFGKPAPLSAVAGN